MCVCVCVCVCLRVRQCMCVLKCVYPPSFRHWDFKGFAFPEVGPWDDAYFFSCFSGGIFSYANHSVAMSALSCPGN